MAFFDSLLPIIAVAGFWVAIILLIYMFLSSRHRERMALVERGVDAKIFSTEKDHSNALKVGVTAIMVGFGIFLGYLLASTGLPGVVAYFTTILLFGGAGLVGFYFLMRNKLNERPDEV